MGLALVEKILTLEKGSVKAENREEDFIELREYQGIIPLSIKNLQEWKKVVEEREKVYVDKKQATGISVNDPLNLAVPNWVTSSWKAYTTKTHHSCPC